MSRAVLIGLGSSIGPRLRTLRLASALVEASPKIRPIARSRVYQSVPLGAARQAFLNAVIRVETCLEGTELLKLCKVAEERLGREQSGRWMDRVIDLDVLFIQGERIDVPGLRVPHAGLLTRPFALIPSKEIGGELWHPDAGTRLEMCPDLGPGRPVIWSCL